MTYLEGVFHNSLLAQPENGACMLQPQLVKFLWGYSTVIYGCLKKVQQSHVDAINKQSKDRKISLRQLGGSKISLKDTVQFRLYLG